MSESEKNSSPAPEANPSNDTWVKSCVEADKEYLRQHKIAELFNNMTEQLFKSRPDKPVEFLTSLLEARRDELLKKTEVEKHE